MKASLLLSWSYACAWVIMRTHSRLKKTHWEFATHLSVASHPLPHDALLQGSEFYLRMGSPDITGRSAWEWRGNRWSLSCSTPSEISGKMFWGQGLKQASHEPCFHLSSVVAIGKAREMQQRELLKTDRQQTPPESPFWRIPTQRQQKHFWDRLWS